MNKNIFITMRRFCVYFIFLFCSQIIFGQSASRSSEEFVKAADMVLDANTMGHARRVLELHGMKVDDRITDDVATLLANNAWGYYEKKLTNAFVYWPDSKMGLCDILVVRLTSYGLDENDIKELYFCLGEYYHAKFLSDLSSFGYKKIKSENKIDEKFKLSLLETTYQKDNHFCIVKKPSGPLMHVSFTRKEREMNRDEKIIAGKCWRYLKLHGTYGAKPYNLTDLNVPEDVPAEFDCHFPPEDTFADMPADILSENLPPIDITLKVNISSQGDKSIDTNNEKGKLFYKWIEPYINVKSAAKVNFPRYGKGFVVGDSYDLRICESKEKYDSCTVILKIKRKVGRFDKAELILKNQKEIDGQLKTIYGNNGNMTADKLWMSCPKERLINATRFNTTFNVKVRIFRRKVTYGFMNQSATYILPFAFSWGYPMK